MRNSKSGISESEFTTLKLILRKLSRLWEQTEYVAFLLIVSVFAALSFYAPSIEETEYLILYKFKFLSSGKSD